MAERARCTAAGRSRASASGRGHEPPEPVAVKPPLRPGQCRAYMRQVLAQEFRGIVDGFVESAKSGSCQHVKLATELLRPTPKKKVRGRGRVQELLEQLEREAGGRC